MKASELIKEAQELIEKHGDHDVLLAFHDPYTWKEDILMDCFKVKFVDFDGLPDCDKSENHIMLWGQA